MKLRDLSLIFAWARVCKDYPAVPAFPEAPVDYLYLLTVPRVQAFFKQCFFFGSGSNVTERNSNFPKIGLTLPDKKVFKMLVRKSTIIW